MAREPGTSTIDWARFPARGTRTPRKIFVEVLEEEDRKFLKERGYDAIVLMEMPRESAHDHQEYLFGLLQGMTDGTIQFDKQRTDAAELELRARHMLNKDSVLSRASNRDDSEIAEVWNWESTTHTLQGNTTFTNPEEIQAFVAAQKAKRFGPGQKKGIERAARKMRLEDSEKSKRLSRASHAANREEHIARAAKARAAKAAKHAARQ